MPRKKQHKPQHLDDEEQSRMKQNSDIHSDRLGGGGATEEDCADMTSVAKCLPDNTAEEAAESNADSKEDGDSLSEDFGSDVAVISNSEWLGVKTSLSSIQQQLQVMRIQQFQIMQLLASKNPNPSTSANNVSSGSVGEPTKQLMAADGMEEKESRREDPDEKKMDESTDIQEIVGSSGSSKIESQLNECAESSVNGESDACDADMCDADQEEGEPESYDCSICSAVLPTPELLKIHQLSHGQPSAPPGGDPGKTAPSSSQYLTNPDSLSLNGAHSTTSLPPSYQSMISDLTNDDSLEEYMEIQKPENTHLEQLAKSVDGTITDPNQCLICKRILSCKSALMMHYRTHTGERPFKCKLCSRAFTTKGNLKTHMGVHRAKPPMRLLHNCPVCNKQFTNALVLNQHMKIHSDEVARKREMDSSSMLLMDESKRARLSLDSAIKNEISEAYSADLNKRPDPFAPMSLTAAAGLSFPFDFPGVVPPMPNQLRYAEAFARQWEQLQQFSMFNPLMPPHPPALFPPGVGIPGGHPPLRMPLMENVNNNASPPTREKTTPTSMCNTNQCMSVSIPNSKALAESPPIIGEDVAPASVPESNNLSTSPKSERSWGSNETSTTSNGMKLEPPPGTTCDLCPKTFACRSALEIHYRSHTKQRPFKCNLCGKAFTTRGNMKQHVLTHKTDDVHWANQERTTSSSRLLQSSYSLERTLSAEDVRKSNTKHQCSICLKHFSSASAVQIHFRTHTGDRPFKCSVCKKAFTTKGNLKVHMGTHMAPQMWNGSPSHPGQRIEINEEMEGNKDRSPRNNNFMDWNAISQASVIKPSLMNGQPPFIPGYPMFLPTNHQEDSSKPWFWQVTCHLCNKECPSPAALELHIKTHAITESNSTKSLTAS